MAGLRKPILVGGIGLSFGLWLWESFGESIIHASEIGGAGMMALGAGFWWLQQRQKTPLQIPSSLDRQAVETAISGAEMVLACLATEAPQQDVSQLKQQLAELPQLLERQELQLAVTGTVGTRVKQLLEAQSDFKTIKEALVTEPSAQSAAQADALASDLLLFVITGDLTDSEWQILQQLEAAKGRLILVFDSYRHTSEESAVVFGQLRQRVQEILPKEDVITISTAPAALKVRQHQEDGSIREWMEQPTPDLSPLQERLTEVIAEERQQLVLATTWREAIALKRKAKEILNTVRRDRALPVVEKYQWIAAAAAFANPVASLDLLATAAINTQLLVDLSAIYQQKFSLPQAQTASGTIGKLMVQLGLVELSTQAIGGMLKSHAFTYVAGGAVQGVSAAYLTRIAGLSLIEYFQEQEVSVTAESGLNLEKLGQKLQLVFQQNQRTAFLQNFVRQALGRLSPPLSDTETVVASPSA